ncbi:hypothetical protein NA57DRAFT_40514 [Rhizodiscina lignyota]|uniref:Uncharacterized protein n=1 Tax=Rhizodiscina lignyota TaxID=1504668 RepID=A0A9P4IBH6_9PEZI|nr:hypothetical protein NA57DRAFT_40514 [Rhizodiscina lignyota]
MLLQSFSKVLVVIASFLIFGSFVYLYHDEEAQVLRELGVWLKDGSKESHSKSSSQSSESLSNDPLQSIIPTHDSLHPPPGDSPHLSAPTTNEEFFVDPLKYNEVFSSSTSFRKFFEIKFGDHSALNPNIIPHPSRDDTWIIVAQEEMRQSTDGTFGPFKELVCNAIFIKDKLACSEPPTVLPVAPTQGGHCKGDLSYFNDNVGPHDARVFYGPDNPYAVYGSNSGFTCFGQWIQDFRMLVEDFGPETMTAELFKDVTELQRPSPYGKIEKNWFVFWDVEGQLYAHYDISPKRVFAQLSADGSVGQNLAPLAASKDDACLARYMPKLAPDLESIHQATNSLLITLCKRSDPTCQQTVENTFIMAIFQHKAFYSFHSVYDPYVVLIKQSAPFEIYAISQKPFWIHGRGPFTEASKSSLWKGKHLPENQTEMFYVTSMSWKAHGQRYHGYIDDVLFVAFGIEDSRTGAIDVLGGDILADLGVCAGI